VGAVKNARALDSDWLMWILILQNSKQDYRSVNFHKSESVNARRLQSRKA